MARSRCSAEAFGASISALARASRRSTSDIDSTVGDAAFVSLRTGQDRRRIVGANPLVQEEAKQMPHRRQPARHARRLEAAPIKVGEVVPQRLGFDAGKASAGWSEKFGKIREIAAICVQRVVARALLRREHVEEQSDQFGIWDLAGTHPPILALIS